MKETKAPVIVRDDPEVAKITKFLLANGFTDSSFEVLNTLSKLIAKNIMCENLVMRKEYEDIKLGASDCDSMRSKLAYYIKKNLARVRENIFNLHEYDIGKFCYGVKGFVDKIVTVYCIYERDPDETKKKHSSECKHENNPERQGDNTWKK